MKGVMLEPGKRAAVQQQQQPPTTSSPCTTSSSSSSGSSTPSPDNFKGPGCGKRTGILCALSKIRPPRELLHSEWIETDSIDGEISQLVTGQPAVATTVKPSTLPASASENVRSSGRHCCKNNTTNSNTNNNNNNNNNTLTSSGYSSHSPPPLSAASYANALANAAAAAANSTGQKQLAPIREGEIIPRPIWPMSPSDDSSGEHSSSPDTASSDAGREGNRREASLYGSAGYRSSCEASSSEYGSSSALSAREVLLELSRTLSSVLEGDCDKSDEEILRDITRTVSVARAGGGGGGRRASSSIYEEIYRNNAGSLASSARDSASTIGVNPINSRLYGHRCYCEKSILCQSRSGSAHPSPKSSNRKGTTPSVYLLPNEHTKSFYQGLENGFVACNCKGYPSDNAQDKLAGKKSAAKQSRGLPNDSRTEKDARFNYPSVVEHEYTTLECSDECSSSSTTSGSKSNTWCNKDFRGFDKNLDFTLDGLRAERLGRAIARAKRRRRWCCVLLVIFGLVFFLLVVVVVSLGVTKGRKVFGSM